ncbi:borrelia PFam12 protein (plasmid) [Borreliella bissettiae DN127]|uniref:Borrelia PFam12 protein n=1 Tax=Borrelia bissettiae (strain DSM 17990 / CIP 109136 / DN127) TaxID=521010 RepID=G0AP62_BORBD|nr:P12 family lipoprotein [Borreliella bissettiae]AEL19488.1 borrelia PFam12 protein [Borreliella bissettiae DN127]
MKKNILATYTLMLLSLSSCDTNAINKLTNKTKEKFVKTPEYTKDLDLIKKIRMDDKESGKQHIKEREQQQVQVVSVESINEKNPEILNSIYYSHQKQIEIKERNLTTNTDEEKEAEKAIIEGAPIFAKLVDNDHELKLKYERLEFNFYNVISKLKKKLENYKRHNNIKRQKIIQLINQFNKKRSDIDELKIKLESGLIEKISAKYFFNQAQKTLKEAIAERSKNKHRNYQSKKTNSNLLAKKALYETTRALDQLATSSIKMAEAMGIKKEIKELIQEAKYILASFKREENK